MYFSTIIATALIAASTMATPAMKLERNPPKKEQVCPFNLPTPQCCATNVLGIADLNCAAPPKVPENEADFFMTCASIGQQAQCCLLPIAGQALVCEEPSSM